MAEVGEERDDWKKIRRGWCMGSEGFVERMKAKLEELSAEPREGDSWSGEAVEEMERERAARALEGGVKRLGYSVRDKLSVMDRYLLARWARHESRVGVKWLAEQLGVRSVGTMSYGIWLVGKHLENDYAVQKRWKLLVSQDPWD